LNRVIKAQELNAMYVIGPGHGGPGIVANAHLVGTYSAVYPDIERDTEGMRRLFRQFWFPGGIPSHVAPETHGSIHEGRELGYALLHAYGAAFDNPDLVVACVVGDGGAETGLLVASWQSNKLFSCYEAVIHIIESMVNQHAKWLKVTNGIPWRQPIASPSYLLTSHVWRQDHNGFSHQDPGFIDHLVNKKAAVVRVYLPPDANTLLSVADHCLRSRQYINLIVAGRQPALSYLSMEEALAHCTQGLGIWEWASNDQVDGTTGLPDVVLACAGDVPPSKPWPRPGCYANTCPGSRCGSSTLSTSSGSSRTASIPTGSPTPSSMLWSHGPAGHLRLPRLPVADPPAHIAGPTTRTSTCVAIRRKGPRPPHSTS